MKHLQKGPSRRLGASSLFMGAAILVLVAASQAFAASGTATGGFGTQTHVGVPFQPPVDNNLDFDFNDPGDGDACAVYSQYSSTANVANSGSATITIGGATYSGLFTITAGTAPTTVWAEGPLGTYANPLTTLPTACVRSTVGYPVPLDRFEIMGGPSGGTSIRCVKSGAATYARVGLDIDWAAVVTCTLPASESPVHVAVDLTLPPMSCTLPVFPITCNYVVDSVTFS